MAAHPFAIVIGASSGIGMALARECLDHGFDVLIAADEPAIEQAAADLRSRGSGRVDVLQADLAGAAGVDRLCAAVGGRRVDALLANAGRGLGDAFLDQAAADWLRVVQTNIIGTLLLLHKVGRDMRAAKSGRILITGSIAGFMPGTYQAVYNASKAFLDNFSFELRHELKDSGVTITCLMPGAPRPSFSTAPTCWMPKIGQSKKDDPAMVARQGFAAMMKGEGDVVTGWQNKLRSPIANITPSDTLAEMHRRMAEPRH